MQLPRELLKKYNKPVPRYTSYPPANHFSDGFKETDHLGAVENSNNWQPQNVSLYIHIPFCKKMCFYCGCNSCKIENENKISAYIDVLVKEISMVAELLDSSRKVSQVHWGGGTPNVLQLQYFERVMSEIRSRFSFVQFPEIAIECNPAYISTDYIEKLVDLGFNRLSFGVQDFDENVLNAVNREPSAVPVEDLVKFIRKYNGISVNLDLMYGLPGQSPESFEKSIDKAIIIRPNRLVTFSYAHVPWVKPAQQQLEKLGLPGQDEKVELFELAYRKLIDSGYHAIGLDHYALPEDELSKALQERMLHRNFQGYCTKETTGQVYAFGVSGISQLEKAYAQNTKDLVKYMNAIKNGRLATEKGMKVTEKQVAIRVVINEIMCNKYLNWDKLTASTGKTKKELQEYVQYDEKRLMEFQNEGLIEFSEDEILIIEKGKFFIRNIAAAFDPGLEDSGKKYSKSI